MTIHKTSQIFFHSIIRLNFWSLILDKLLYEIKQVKYTGQLDFFKFERDGFTTKLYNLFDPNNWPVNCIYLSAYTLRNQRKFSSAFHSLTAARANFKNSWESWVMRVCLLTKVCFNLMTHVTM